MADLQNGLTLSKIAEPGEQRALEEPIQAQADPIRRWSPDVKLLCASVRSPDSPGLPCHRSGSPPDLQKHPLSCPIQVSIQQKGNPDCGTPWVHHASLLHCDW